MGEALILHPACSRLLTSHREIHGHWMSVRDTVKVICPARAQSYTCQSHTHQSCGPCRCHGDAISASLSQPGNHGNVLGAAAAAYAMPLREGGSQTHLLAAGKPEPQNCL